MSDDSGRANLVLSLVHPTIPTVSRIVRDRFIPEVRDEVAKVLREAHANGQPIVTNKRGSSWTITIGAATVYIEIHK